MYVIVNQALRLADADGNSLSLPFSNGVPIFAPNWLEQHPDFQTLLASGALAVNNSPLILPATGYYQQGGTFGPVGKTDHSGALGGIGGVMQLGTAGDATLAPGEDPTSTTGVPDGGPGSLAGVPEISPAMMTNTQLTGDAKGSTTGVPDTNPGSQSPDPVVVPPVTPQPVVTPAASVPVETANAQANAKATEAAAKPAAAKDATKPSAKDSAKATEAAKKPDGF